MFSISTRNLARQRRNTILTLIVIIVSMFTFILSVSVVANPSLDTREYSIATPGEGVNVFDYQKFLSNEDLSSINVLDGVTEVFPRFKMLGRLNVNELRVTNGTGVSRSIALPFAANYSLEIPYTDYSSLLTSGTLPRDPLDIVITADIANDLSLSVGDNVTISSLAYTDFNAYNVSGIMDIASLEAFIDFTGNYILPEDPDDPNRGPVSGDKSALLSFDAIWRLLPTVRSTLVSPNKYNQITIKTDSEVDLSNLALSIIDENDVGETKEIMVSDGTSRQYITVATSTVVRGLTFMIFVLAITGLIMLNTITGAISSRMKELEVWSSVGANPSHIRSNFIFESLIFGVVGGTLGYIGAVLLAFIGNVLSIDTTITPDKLDFNWLFITVVVSSLVCIMASIFPSRRASTKVVPSLRRSWKPSLTKMLTSQFTFEQEEIPITLEPEDFNIYAEYICEKMEIPTFFKVKRTWPVTITELKDGKKKRSFKLDVAVFSAEGTYALVQMWSIEEPGKETMQVFCKINPYSSFGAEGDWTQNHSNFNKACFDTLNMLRRLSLKWRVEGRKLVIERD